jgi:hypothetical protein
VPVFLLVVRESRLPLDLIELGPSGGLNLVWDRYRHRYGDAVWGPDDAPLELQGEVRRPFPRQLLSVTPEIRRRRGIDLNPVDVSTEAGARLLESFVWADQTDRIERLRRAIEALRAHPPELIEGDYVQLLPELLGDREKGVLTVVFQTTSLGYLRRERREEVLATLDTAAAAGPLAWVSAPSGPWMDEGFGVGVRVWPGSERRVAVMDFHGAWLDWRL